MDDSLVRQLELFIRNGGDMETFKSILSVSGDNNEFLKNLTNYNLKWIQAE
jgi:hypothetical protein